MARDDVSPGWAMTPSGELPDLPGPGSAWCVVQSTELPDIPGLPPTCSDEHAYLSTACLHDNCEHCQSETSLAGEPKVPGTCKWCGVACVCPCHRGLENSGRRGRVLVTGSRDWSSAFAVLKGLEDARRDLRVSWARLTVVHGGCPTGADAQAGLARVLGAAVEVHEADWKAHGRAAGPIRNRHMVGLGADLCLAFIWNGSPGASMCASAAERAGIPTRRLEWSDLRAREDWPT